jgi:hypothetical protein
VTMNLRRVLASCCARLLIAPCVLAAGCSSETLFQSNFDSTPDNQPPAHVQSVGTANIDGPPGSVIVVPPPVTPSGKWVQISRAGAQSPVAGLQGNFSQFRGDGSYTFSATLFIPAGSGIATIQFEPFSQSASTLTNFLHIDFTQDNRVRIDDDESTKFGTFPRGQPFIVQVTLAINAASSAHIVLSGAGASGEADRNVAAPFRLLASQFGAVRAWMGFPWVGSFQATNIAVTRRTG